MNSAAEGLDYQVGTRVYDAHGDKVGTIQATTPSYLIVGQGIIIRRRLYIPRNAIANFTDGKIYLEVPKQDSPLRGWPVKPDSIA